MTQLTLRVQVIAPFEIEGQSADGWLEVPQGARVGDLLKQRPRPPLFMRLLPVSVNGEQCSHRRRLADDDRVVFLVPRAGG